jgi:exosome complex RNA-binding protein Rrp42 (RNase PH superfamily)
VEITRFLEKLLKSSRAIDTESLCIMNGKIVWSINITISIIDYDGNIIDPISLAILLSLQNIK